MFFLFGGRGFPSFLTCCMLVHKRNQLYDLVFSSCFWFDILLAIGFAI